MPYRILHLSDLHFGEQHAFAQDGAPVGQRSISETIVYSLTKADQPTEFDLVVLSGDLYTRVSQDERIKARLELHKLRAQFSEARWVVVPGNHDLSWDDAVRDDRFVHFNNVVNELWPKMALPRDLPAVTTIESQAGSRPVAVLALDSCRLEGPVQRGLGYISDKQLELIPARLEEAGVTAETHTIVAVLHHHLLAVSSVPELPASAHPESEERVISSVTLDASRTLRALADAGVALVLLGHQHAPKVLAYKDLDWGDRGPLHVAAAGSCGIADVNMLRQFFVWEIDDEQIVARSMRQDTGDPFEFELLDPYPPLSIGAPAGSAAAG